MSKLTQDRAGSWGIRIQPVRQLGIWNWSLEIGTLVIGKGYDKIGPL